MSFTWNWVEEDVTPDIVPPPKCCIDDHERSGDAIATKRLTFMQARGFDGAVTRGSRFFCAYHLLTVKTAKDILAEAGFGIAVMTK